MIARAVSGFAGSMSELIVFALDARQCVDGSLSIKWRKPAPTTQPRGSLCGPTVVQMNSSSKLVAGVYGGQIYTSTDSGVKWTPRESTRDWIAVASSADGNKLVAAVYNGQIYTSVPQSTSGTGDYLLGGQHSALELQSAGNGQFLPLGFTGNITAY